MKKLKKNINDSRNSSRHTYYWFECDCGNTVSVRGDSKKEYCNIGECKFSKRIMHGKSRTPLYSTWEGIRARLYNENAKAYSTYGAKNISMCEEWENFENFEKWSLANGWKKGLTIDRKKIEENYSPENCRWITRSENTKYQHKDGHGTSKPIILIYKCKTQEKYFPTLKSCTEYMIDNNLVKSKSHHTIVRMISKIKNTNKDYFGWTFK